MQGGTAAASHRIPFWFFWLFCLFGLFVRGMGTVVFFFVVVGKVKGSD